MGRPPVAWVQLATRIPWPLMREVKIACVEDGMKITQFVASALREKLVARRKEKA